MPARVTFEKIAAGLSDGYSVLLAFGDMPGWLELIRSLRPSLHDTETPSRHRQAGEVARIPAR